MNELKGKIKDLLIAGDLCLLSIDIQGFVVKALIIETPASNPNLYVDASVRVLFKETEVILVKGSDLQISIQNRLPCLVKSVQRGKILSRVLMQFDAFSLAALITTEAWEALNLHIDDQVWALVKANEVMISS
ncbi:MAG: TOBE domain-containing protein [Microscillaceae bacterium]|nr:TOBE domain-containing protein [Microscillaceae bacterium]